jgi:uncharacterized protein YbjQ (UPF0145 family)
MPTQPSHCVTTASSIEGWEIDEHLGVVASHAVAGTDLLSELFAGFTDIFGGRSNAYRKELESLYRDTIVGLLSQARARGGNWLVGLRIDLDEVTGKGTQMFMITGLATAVRARRLPRPTESAQKSVAYLETAEVATMVTRLALLKTLDNDKNRLADTDWAFLVEHRVEEACPALLRRYAAVYRAPDESAAIRPKAGAVFAAVTPATATRVLYEGLREPSLAVPAIDLIRDCSLCSYPDILTCLQINDTEVRRSALQTLRAAPPGYSDSSLADIDRLIGLLPTAFPDRSKAVEKKGMLGGAKQLWQCTCGTANASGDTYCSHCFRDPHGLASGDLTPAQAVVLLDATRAALAALLSGRTLT